MPFWVREVFRLIAIGRSFNAIAKHLQEQKAPVGRNIKKWTAKAVARVALKIMKYSGAEWTWGATVTIRDAKGRKKRVAAPEDEVVRVKRPDLRIVDAETASRAQEKLEIIYRLYRFKEGQKKRGPKVHYSEIYPTDILFKLLFCGACGSVLYQNGSGSRIYRQCKHYGNAPDDCHAKTRVPADEARTVLTEFAAELLRAVPDWLETSIAKMNEIVRQQQTRLPEAIRILKHQHLALVERRTRLLDLVESGRYPLPAQSSSGDLPRSSILQRIDELDQEIGNIVSKIAETERQLRSAIELPDNAFIEEQIRQLPSAICSDELRAASLLSEIFDTVRVFRVVPPGMERGYHELRFRLSAWRIFKAALVGQFPDGILGALSEHKVAVCESPEFCLIVRPRRAECGGSA